MPESRVPLQEVPLGSRVLLEATVVRHKKSGQVLLHIPGVGGSGAWSMPPTAEVEVLSPPNPDMAALIAANRVGTAE